jgi:hypothetical protein
VLLTRPCLLVSVSASNYYKSHLSIFYLAFHQPTNTPNFIHQIPSSFHSQAFKPPPHSCCI